MTAPTFQVSLSDLNNLFEHRGDAFRHVIIERFPDGLAGLVEALQSSQQSGIPGTASDVEARKRAFGENRTTEAGTISRWRSILRIIGQALCDCVLIFLLVGVFDLVVSSATGTGALVVVADCGQLFVPPWVGGFCIILSVLIIVVVKVAGIVGFSCSRLGEPEPSKEATVTVMRANTLADIPISQVLVGDVMLLNEGDAVQVDGVILEETQLQIDESVLTGDPDLVSKQPCSDILAGTTVATGHAKMLVLAVGKNVMSGYFDQEVGSEVNSGCSTACCAGVEEKHLGCSVELQRVVRGMVVAGAVLMVVAFLVLLIRFCVENFVIEGKAWSMYYINHIVKFLVMSALLIVTASMPGLQSACRKAFHYHVGHMVDMGVGLRVFKAIENMLLVTDVCIGSDSHVFSAGEHIITEDVPENERVEIVDPYRFTKQDVIKLKRYEIVVRYCTCGEEEGAEIIAKRYGIVTNNDVNYVYREKGQSTARDMSSIGQKVILIAESNNSIYSIVENMKSSGRVVAFFGESIASASALRSACIGVCHSQCSDVVKEASDIVTPPVKFSNTSLVWFTKLLLLSHHVHSRLVSIVQFQLTTSIVASLLTFLTVCGAIWTPFLADIHIVWSCLLLTTFLNLALALERSFPLRWHEDRQLRTSSLFQPTAIRHIIGHSLFQILLLVIINLSLSPSFFDPPPCDGRYHLTLQQKTSFLFNIFTMCVLFNAINNRRSASESHVFADITKNVPFLVAWLLLFAVQVLLVQLGGGVFDTWPLTLDEWLWCVCLGGGPVLLWDQLLKALPVVGCPGARRRRQQQGPGDGDKDVDTEMQALRHDTD